MHSFSDQVKSVFAATSNKFMAKFQSKKRVSTNTSREKIEKQRIGSHATHLDYEDDVNQYNSEKSDNLKTNRVIIQSKQLSTNYQKNFDIDGSTDNRRISEFASLNSRADMVTPDFDAMNMATPDFHDKAVFKFDRGDSKDSMFKNTEDHFNNRKITPSLLTVDSAYDTPKSNISDATTIPGQQVTGSHLQIPGFFVKDDGEVKRQSHTEIGVKKLEGSHSELHVSDLQDDGNRSRDLDGNKVTSKNGSRRGSKSPSRNVFGTAGVNILGK